MIAVLLETMFQVKEMIKANDLKHIDVCYFYVFFLFVSRECPHILAHLVLWCLACIYFGKRMAIFLVYFKWNNLEEVIG